MDKDVSSEDGALSSEEEEDDDEEQEEDVSNDTRLVPLGFFFCV